MVISQDFTHTAQPYRWTCCEAPKSLNREGRSDAKDGGIVNRGNVTEREDPRLVAIGAGGEDAG